MAAQIREFAGNERLRAALDWTVFGIGAASLTLAVAATIVLHAGP